MFSKVPHQKAIGSAICLTLLLAGAGCSRTPAPREGDVGQTDAAAIEQRHREQQKAAEIEPNPVTATVTATAAAVTRIRVARRPAVKEERTFPLPQCDIGGGGSIAQRSWVHPLSKLG